MPTPGYVFKNSGTTPPAIVEQTEDAFPLQQIRSGDETNGQLNRQTDARSQPETFPQHKQTEPQLHSQYIPESITRLSLAPGIQEVAAEIKNEIRKGLEVDSDELTQESPPIKGAVQTHQNGESISQVRDIGWHKPSVEIPDPLIGGVPNGRLFAMIRRFNKYVFAVRSVPLQNSRDLDLNEAWDDEYDTDKLTLHLQRVYFTFVLGLASLGNQVSRLRSWKEPRRSSVFFVAYLSAWIFDLLMPLVFGTLIIVVASKEAREVVFPSAPRSLVNTSTGGLQKPQAGQLGTSGTLTGAPEKQEGEAVEEEAAKFVDNIRHLMQRAVGMHEKPKNDGDPLEEKIPKPIRNAVKAVKAQGSTSGHATEDGSQTEKPMEDVLWSKVSPEILAPVIKAVPHVVGEIADTWERFANVISPTPPFSLYSFIRVDGVLLPLFLGSFFISSYMVYKGAGFAIGFGMFGDPILTPALEWFNRSYPNWTKFLAPKNNILRGVPNNSQLTLTLLRIGEAHNTPLPPPPGSDPNDPDLENPIDIDHIPIEASREEKVDAIEPSSAQKAHPGDSTEEDNKNEPKHKRLSKISRMFKGNAKSIVEAKLSIDQVRAAAGSEKVKCRLGVLPKPKNLVYAGPRDFKARYDGKKGWLCIAESSNPVLTFTAHDPSQDDSHTETEPLLKIVVGEIKELKRAAAFVSKPAEMAANWSTEKQLLGGLEIVDIAGKTWRFTALPEREELFNRLIALGSQRWENL